MAENNFRAARRASDITLESAGEICAVSRVTYQQKETNPGNFRLSELKALYEALSDTSKDIMRQAVVFFICGDDCIKRN